MDYLIIRLLSAMLAGLLLSLSGSLIQLGTKNILASPSTLGVDGLTILWLLIFHSLSLSLGLNSPYLFFLLGIPVFIFVGLSYARALKGRDHFERIILLGLTFNLLVGAVFSLWQFFFMAFNQPFPMEVWFGHFRHASVFSLQLLLVGVVAIGIGYILLFRQLNLLSLSSNIARNFGLKRDKFYAGLFVMAVCSTFIVVCLYGAFSFLGLVFPVVARKLWFERFDLKGEILWGAFFNGLMLMLVDYLCYAFPIMGAELPVGLIATAIGAVSLILLLWKGNKQGQLLAKL